LGGFIGNYSPARIDPVHHAFTPPGKKLLFNIHLNQNDGLLANCVAASCGVSYADAIRMIEELTEECRHTLKSGKSFIIPGVGRLSQGREGNWQFEQDRTVNLLPDAFGLTSFISPPVGRAIAPAKEFTRANTEMEAPERRNTLSRSLKWAAILAVPIGAAAILGVTQFGNIYTTPLSNAGILSSVFSRFSSTSLVEKKEAPSTPSETIYHQDPAPSVFDNPSSESKSADADAILNSKTNPSADVSANPVNSAERLTTPEPTPAPSNPEDPFAIIIGAFKSRENAEKFVGGLKQKGITSSVYDQSRSGLYRVSIGTFTIREEAEQLLATAKSGDFPGAWLLAK